MAVISLPLSFNNSFWTQDYRKGVEILFRKLEQGVVENDEIIAFVTARASAEASLASSLRGAIHHTGAGFHADDGASLLTAFRGLQTESQEQAKAHDAVADDLRTAVMNPFKQWAPGHKEKLRQAKTVALESWLRSYEFAVDDVRKLKDQYLAKTRRADEAEDDARLVSNEMSDKYTSPTRGSPQLSPRIPSKGPFRKQSVSERITQRFKEFGRSSSLADPPQSERVFDAESEKSPLVLDKGKGKAIDRDPAFPPSPPPLDDPLPPALIITSPPDREPVFLAGLPFAHSAIVQLLTQAKGELPLRAVRFPILGEYQDCFSGEEFVTWLKDNVQAFNRNLDIAETAAKDLAEREDLLRRLGELGNAFVNSDDAFYQFRSKAFTFGQILAVRSSNEVVASPIQRIAPVADNLVKTSNNFVNIVSKALTSGPAEAPFLRLRREAEIADKNYRDAVRMLDRQRLGLEERIEDLFKTLQKWETDRLRRIQTVLHQYQGSVASLRKAYDSSIDRTAPFVSSYNPDSDLIALIERYRTGPFRPTAHAYESVAHDESDVVFGIDLRKWAEGGWSTIHNGEEKKDQVPPMLLTLLNALNDKYQKIPDHEERRKAWIYDVPLTAVHHLRESLNAVPTGQDIPEDLLIKYDAPTIAATIKLWLLELDPPLGMYEGWDEVRKLYPQVGAVRPEGEVPQEQHLEAIQYALQKLPKVHLFVIDAIVHHLKELINKTDSKESDEVYLTKLALSIGRGIIRPKQENELSIHDRHPTLFFTDLIEHYEQLLPPTITKKKRESERKVPTRKRTQIVDMRMRRSNLSDAVDLKDVIFAQHHIKSPNPSPRSPPTSGVAFTPSITPTIAIIPENIKVQAPVPVQPKSQGMVAVLEPDFPAHESSYSSTLAPPPPLPPAAFITPPPPPPIVSAPAPPPITAPPPSTIRSEDPSLPPRPTFKAPPAGLDDLPPRPTFKEPPAEMDDLPPRPTFREPPPEMDDLPPRPTFKEPPPEMDDLPPRPTFKDSPVDGSEDDRMYKAAESPHRETAARPSSLSRSSSPAITGASNLSRAGSNRIRGPRLTRGPRAVGKRDSIDPQSTSPPAAPLTRGHVRAGSRGSMTKTTTTRRSGSSSSFSRTVASDAEVR